MKRAKIFIPTAVFTLFMMIAGVYSSCKNDACKGVVCENGGGCSNGVCSCPAGYTGSSCQLAAIVLQNNTFTTVSISTNGSAATIPAGSSLIYGATQGSVVNISATTSGTNSLGTQAGAQVSWSFSDTISAGGAGFTQPFDVSASYFYLQLVNNDPAQYIDSLYVNYGTPLQTLDAVSIPNDRNTYGVGYYRDNSNTTIYALGGGLNWTFHPNMPNAINSTVVVRVN